MIAIGQKQPFERNGSHGKRDQRPDTRRALTEVYMHRHLQYAQSEGYVDVTSNAQS